MIYSDLHDILLITIGVLVRNLISVPKVSLYSLSRHMHICISFLNNDQLIFAGRLSYDDCI